MVGRTRSLGNQCSAIVLVGGLGTRLRSVFGSAPKCMAPIGDRKFLEYLFDWLNSWGLKEVILCVGYQGTAIQQWLDDVKQCNGLKISYSVETKLLGTAGAIKNAEHLGLGSLLLVLNGDSFVDVDLRDMLRFHRVRKALATIALVRAPDSSRFGSVQLGPRGEIKCFKEKDQSDMSLSIPQSHLINAGVYLFEKKILDYIAVAKPVSLEKDVFPKLVGAGLYGFESNGYFIDIGVPQDYRRAQVELPGRFCL